MSYSISLTRAAKGYDGNPRRMEVIPFSKDIHSNPGIYLQEVEGCGSTVFELTPIEALALAAHLKNAAEESMADFKE